MLASKKKISVRQAITLFYMATLSPTIRLFPQYAAKMAGKAGWLAPVVAVIPISVLILVLNAFFKKKKEINLTDVYCDILGGLAGRILASLYLLWLFVLLALYTRYYAERMLSSILPHTSIAFIIISLLLLVFFAARGGLVPVARAGEIFFGIYLMVFVIIFILASPDVSLRNYMNVSYLDAWPVVKASHLIITIWGFLLYTFFFGDKINNKEEIIRFSFQGLALKFVLGVILLIVTIGILGPVLTSHVSLPFFMVVKNISILGAVERLEPIPLALWLISDFSIITFFTFVATSLIKSIFKVSAEKQLVTPVILITGVGSFFIAQSRFELEAFSIGVAMPVNTVFTIVIPILVFVIGKLRKKI